LFIVYCREKRSMSPLSLRPYAIRPTDPTMTTTRQLRMSKVTEINMSTVEAAAVVLDQALQEATSGRKARAREKEELMVRERR
jgi:uncharacterized protein YdeI (YjbR/CyaY-like superfamily)